MPQLKQYDGATWQLVTDEDHRDASDPHTGYALLAGRSGGQTLKGGTDSGDDLTLQSTSNATKGSILFGTSEYDEVNNRLGIATTSPTHALDVNADSIRIRTSKTPSNATDTGTAGEIAWDGDYFYICYATDTWGRLSFEKGPWI